MRYDPRQPRDDVNVSKTHPLAEASTLIVGLSLLFALLLVAIIFLVDAVLYVVPPEKEAAVLAKWLPVDLVSVEHDNLRYKELDQLLVRLLRHWPDAAYNFRIEIDDSPQLNAMALPGGLIVVTTGLLDAVETENELAFVLGHELGHFRNRDQIRGLGRVVALGILFAAIGRTDGQALGARIADLTLRGFSREQESAADDFALGLVFREYGHVADAWRFFERLQIGKDNVLQLVGYLSTHPLPGKRVQILQDSARRNGWPLNGPVTALPWCVTLIPGKSCGSDISLDATEDHN